MTPQELKNSILQLAIQGKLVEQRPEEGTAEELFAQIQEEKQRLIAEKKIKKEKPLPEVTEDEKPFDIPECWKWVRWGELSQSIQYGYNAPAQESGRIKMVRISDIQDGKVMWDSVPYCEIKEEDIPAYLLGANDILFARTGGTVGKSYLVKEVPEESIYAGYLIRTRYSSFLSPEYLKCFMESPLYWEQLRNGTIATAQPNCNGKTLSKMILPLPPLAEQKRIVSKIEELLPYIDRYEQAWSKLEQFNSRFPEDMKKSLLQYAIQGKLVEQRPEEGTAEELFAQIQEERQRLIAEKKIKKEKPLPEIAEDEKPFDIPENWKWVRMGSIASKITDGEHKTPHRVDSYQGFYLLSARNIRDGYILLDDVDYVDEEEFKKISRRCNPQRGDVLISCSGSVGRCSTVEDNNLYVMVRSAAMIAPVFLNSKYLMYTVQSEVVQGQIRNKTKQTAQANLFQEAIRTLIIPLPPLAEQKRIVEKLEQLLPLCERLK